MKRGDTKTIPMGPCAVCTECYREEGTRPERCHFGGPFLGYRYVETGKIVTREEK